MRAGRLRIAWAGPLKAGSAIGRDGLRIVGGLRARGHEVALIATDHAWGPATPALDAGGPVLHWAEADLARLAVDHDAVVVNVGDHFLNHAGVFPLLEAAPCLAVVHDMYLGNLFNGWLWWNGSRPGLREAEMAAVYGAEGARLARRIEQGALTLDAQAALAPMTEWVARRAAGALAHARFYLPRLLEACPGPVDVAGLPVAPRGVPPVTAKPPGRPLTLLTVGVVNPNKCVDRVVEAVASSPALRRALRYRVVGPVAPEERARLEAVAAGAGWDGLSLEGAATEVELEAALADADVIACLRRPVLEGASGSLVEALLTGRPVLVADAGGYADVPADAVARTPAEVPVPAVRTALEALVADPGGRAAIGERGRAYAERAHDLDRYLDVLEPLMRATAAAAPVLRMARNLGGLLAELGLAPDDPAVARTARTLAPLFAPPQPGETASQGASSAAG